MIDLNALLTAPQGIKGEDGVRTVVRVPIPNSIPGAPDLNVRHVMVSCLLSYRVPKGPGSTDKSTVMETLANLLELQDTFEPCARTLALLKEAFDENAPGFGTLALGQVSKLLWPVVVE